MSQGCKADVRPQICEVTPAEAAMRLGKEVSGEAASQLVSDAQREQTHRVAGFALAIVQPALDELARHKADIAGLVTAAGGPAAVSAAVARAEAHQAYLRSYGEKRDAAMAAVEGRYVAALKAEEGVQVGDTFRVVAHPGLPAGSVGEVVELYPLGCVGIIGPGWRLTTSAQVLLGPGWELVRAVEALPVRAEVGDRFECLASPREWIPVGTVTRVADIDDDDERWMRLDGAGPSGFCATLADLRNPKLYRPLPAPVAATTEGETSEGFGPEADELPFADQREDRRAQAHAASVAAMGWAEDVKKLQAAWADLFAGKPGAGLSVDLAISALAKRAGLLLPSKLPVPA